MEYLIIACVIGVIPAFIASSKGRNFFLWWLYGACLFIVALIHSLVISKDMKAIAEEKKAQGYKECPFCKEYVKPGAVVCPHCQRDIPQPTAEEIAKAEAETVVCPTCHYRAPKDADCCPRCDNLIH